MSGAPQSRSGNQGQHLKAAHDWLERAEAQFKTDQDIVAAGTIMLAQAELRLIVEGVVSEPLTAPRKSRTRGSRIFHIPRAVIGAAALAACLALGIFLGTAINPGMPDESSIELPVAIANVPEIPSAVSEPETVPDEVIPETTVEELAVADNVETIEAVEVAESYEAPAPQPSRPVYRPQPASQPVVTETPDVSEPPDTSQPSEAGESAPEDEPVDDEVHPSDDVINPAEIALRTIQAITERLNNWEAE